MLLAGLPIIASGLLLLLPLAIVAPTFLLAVLVVRWHICFVCMA